jgi:light-regulated signal transduction histidine kinase (bacteriophytochrome)
MSSSPVVATHGQNAAAIARSAAESLDLTGCAREPIHVPHSIQPHGTLLVLTPELVIEAVAANVEEYLGQSPASLLSAPVASLIGDELAGLLRRSVCGQSVPNPVYMFTLAVPGRRTMNAIAHCHDGRLLIDFEPTPSPPAYAANSVGSFQSLYPSIRESVQRLEQSESLRDLYVRAAEDVRRLAGFDRVMIYQFDADWHGWVVGEARAPDVTSYLDHHFPASDIPAQARELYRLNRSRVIVDAGYRPVPLVTAGPLPRPIDLSYSLLRSVSPVHIEYLHNMGVAASTSFSIIRHGGGGEEGPGKLWGLIACHHRTPLAVPFEVRTACEFLAQVIGIQIGAQERRSHDEHRLRLQAAQTRLLAAMAPEENLRGSLLAAGPQLLDFMSAGGAALYFNKEVTLVGATPPKEAVQQILDMLILKEDRDLWSTECLASVLPEARAYKDTAAGLLAMRISQFVNSYILWFRPEKIRTITWGGDPHKPATSAAPAAGGETGERGGTGAESAGRIHPRKSFEQWKQIVQDLSDAWTPEELEAAVEFRSAVVNIVLRKVEELAGMAAELKRANSELEAFSYSVSHDLRAPFRHISGFSDLLARRTAKTLDETSQRYVKVIGDAARHAGKLVDALLAFAHIARVQLHKSETSLPAIIAAVRRDLEPETRGRTIEWRIALAPDGQTAFADPTLLHLVLQNLVSNALKFTRHVNPAVIEISSRVDILPEFGQPPRALDLRRPQLIVAVRDNGAGFEGQYVHKLFSPFQRLHTMEEFEGTGIGLANVKRIVERHGGTAWAEGSPNAGATIYFSLPTASSPEPDPETP